MAIDNAILPQINSEITIRKNAEEEKIVVDGDSTFNTQLRDFIGWARGGSPMPTDAHEAVENMRLIDAVTSGGMRKRGA